MKKLKISMLAMLFTVGIGGAVIQKIEAAPKRALATYQWQKYLSDGVTRDPSHDETATISQAQSDYGCAGTGNQCAVGAKVAGSGTGPNSSILQFN
jgi:hypothetical protein